MRRLLLVGLIFWTSSALAQDLITKVIELRFVPSEKVIQLIQPLLQTDEKISASGQTLVVKVHSETLTQIRTILHQIDVPPTTFHVSIYQGDPQWLSTQNNNSVIYSTNTRAQTLQNQSVNVMSGESALVTMNQEVPVVSAVGIGFFTGISYQQHSIKNGILVHPVLKGSQVQLTVRRLREQENPAGGQQFDNQQIDTTVMIPLNKWVSLGAPEGAQVTVDNSTSYSAGRTFSQQSTLYIKISILGSTPKGVAPADGNMSW